jgi:hypothetical protein
MADAGVRERGSRTFEAAYRNARNVTATTVVQREGLTPAHGMRARRRAAGAWRMCSDIRVQLR